MKNTWNLDDAAVDYSLLEKVNPVFNTENMPKLNSLDMVSTEQAAAVREGMKNCAFWKITPSGTAVELPSAETEGFHVDASIQAGILSLALAGRLDTITAPSLLSFFEDVNTEQAIEAVQIDCSRLDYISSAGLRVLLIMHKACKGGVSLHGENEAVSVFTRHVPILKIQSIAIHLVSASAPYPEYSLASLKR